MPRVVVAVRLQPVAVMLLHNPLVTGLFGVGCLLGFLWGAPSDPPATPDREVVLSAVAAEAYVEGSMTCRSQGLPVNVVDAAAAVATPALVSELIRLGPGERVAAVDDHPVANDLAAGARIAARFQSGIIGADGIARDLPLPSVGVQLPVRRGPIRGGDYIDVTVEGERGSRRVLVLLH